MTAFWAAWITQDLIQVFGVGLFPVPDLVLFLLLYRLSGESPDVIPVIWLAVMAGLLWDLRWASFAGPSSMLFVVASVIYYLVWINVPVAGRNTFLALVLMLMSQLFVSLGRVLFAFGKPQIVVQFGMMQVVLALPAVVVAAWMVGRNLRAHE